MSQAYQAHFDHNLTTQGAGFTLWKEAKTGLYRWLSVYSNNYRDDDHPAEIISARSHQTYVEMVNKGMVDYPELWLWHVPVAWGKADFVDYHNGFALAAGYIYPGCEFIAESLSKETNLATSHGMPDELIFRDPDDASVIDFHITREISPLPLHRAANKRTGFVLLKGEEVMPFPAEKRTWMAEKAKLPPAFIKQLEDHLDAVAAEAEASGVASKEASPPVETAATETAAAPTTHVAATEPAATEEPVVAATDADKLKISVKEAGFATTEEVAQAMAEVMSPLVESMSALTAQVAQLTKELSEVSRVEADNQEKLKEVTPPLSLKELIANNLIGSAKARVDTTSDLHGDKPKEKEANPAYGPTLVPFLNGIMANPARDK